jgi:multidrug efflux pump subunit AcrB
LNARELFPSISFPQLVVITRYGNAAPEEIENLITKVIEESVGTVPNLKRVRSLSKEGVSLVTWSSTGGPTWGSPTWPAREKIDQIKDRLPSEAEEPIINRINPFAQPMMIFSRLMRLDGVAEVVDTLKEKTSFSRYNGQKRPFQSPFKNRPTPTRFPPRFGCGLPWKN